MQTSDSPLHYSSCCFKLGGVFALDDQLVAIWAASQRAVRSFHFRLLDLGPNRLAATIAANAEVHSYRIPHASKVCAFGHDL